MANPYSQIHLQFVFAVKYRQSLIPKQHKEELHKYITALVQNRKAKMLFVKGWNEVNMGVIGLGGGERIKR